MKNAAIALSILAVACGSEPPVEQVILEIEGEFEDGQLRIRPIFDTSAHGVTDLTVVADGVAGSGPADTVELVTEPGATIVAGGCGALGNAFEADVTVRTFYPRLRNVHVEITQMWPSTGNEACNSDPEAFGASDQYGLWSYPDVFEALSAQTRHWKLRYVSGRFSFRGRVIGDIESIPPPPPPDRCGLPPWIWSNPRPTGEYLTGVWARSASETWAVGYFGGVLRGDGTTWTPIETCNGGLFGISGLPSGEAWIAGDDGLIRRYDGTSWIGEESGSNEDLKAVWAAAPTEAWAVGTNGTILHRTSAGTWSVVPSGTTVTLSAVWGSSINDVWATGDGGTILRYDGVSWSIVTSPTTRGLRGLWGTAANNVWAVGDQGTIVRWNGAVWATVPSGTGEYLTAVWGTSASNIWAVGFSRRLRWNGSVWGGAADYAMSAIHGTGPDDIWSVGSQGMIQHKTASWAPITVTTLPIATRNSNAIWGTSNSDVWVGGNGRLARWNGSAWTHFSTSGEIEGIWGSSPTNVFTVGTHARRWNGTSWTESLLYYANGGGTNAPGFHGVHGSSATNVWAVGWDGLVARWNGTSWNEHTPRPPTTTLIRDIWVSSPTDVWIAGEWGLMMHWDGVAWTTITLPTAQSLFGLWGTGPNDIWAVGWEVFHYDGVSWTLVAEPAGTGLSDVWGSGPNDVWAAGWGPDIIHWDGTSWRAVLDPGADVAGVWVSPTGTPWFTDDNRVFHR